MAVGNLRTDGVVHLESAPCDGRQSFADGRVLRGALGGLGEYFHRGLWINQPGVDSLLQHPYILNDNGISVHLSEKSKDFCVADFSKYYEIAVAAVRMRYH